MPGFLKQPQLLQQQLPMPALQGHAHQGRSSTKAPPTFTILNCLLTGARQTKNGP